MEDFCYTKEAITCYPVPPKSTPFAVSKDEWNTKKDNGKYMKHALYVLWCAKRHLLTSNSEKLRAIVELCYVV